MSKFTTFKANPTASGEPQKESKSRRGGARPGAGRPKGTGLLGDTVSVRIPREHAETIFKARDSLARGNPIPGSAALLDFFDGKEIRAGFPTPSSDDDSPARQIDLYSLLAPRPESCFLVKISGQSMKDAGIVDGDFLLIDKSIEPKSGHIVIAHVEGQGMVAKRLRIDRSGAALESANPEFPPIALREGCGARIWGVARAKIGKFI